MIDNPLSARDYWRLACLLAFSLAYMLSLGLLAYHAIVQVCR